MSALSQFASFFTGGGPFMFIILGVAVVILAVSLERFWIVSRASAWNSRKLAKDLSDRVRGGDTHAAVEIARKVKAPPGQVALAILTSGARTEEGLLNAAEGEAAVLLPPLSRRLPFLSLLANTATLLGLLGTIFGLTMAFSAVGAADPSQRSAFLAVGISQALNTTAFGLIVAVPALLVHGFLVSRVERAIEQVDEITVRLVRSFVHAAAQQPTATTGLQTQSAGSPATAAPGSARTSGVHAAPQHARAAAGR